MVSRRRKSGAKYFQRLVARVTSLGRTTRLQHQLAEIERRSLELPPSFRAQLAELIGRECDNVAACADPAHYGTQTQAGVISSGLDLGFDRARSENVQVRMRGLALWIALVFHDTRNAATPDAQELHRAILRVMRELRVFSSRIETTRGHA